MVWGSVSERSLRPLDRATSSAISGCYTWAKFQLPFLPTPSGNRPWLSGPASIWMENAVNPLTLSRLLDLPCPHQGGAETIPGQAHDLAGGQPGHNPFLPRLALIRGTLKPSLAKHMTRLEGNRATILAFYAKQDLENSIALLGAASKGDEEVRSWAKI